MTTDRPMARGLSPVLPSSPEAQVQAQLDEFHRLILQCRRYTDEANALIHQSSRMLETSATCLNNSAASMAQDRRMGRDRGPG